MLTRRRNEVDVDRVRTALRAVHDPELGRPLAELDMLGDVQARRGRVRVVVRLTTASCPLAEELRHAVSTAVSGVDGVRAVDVSFVTMPPRERAELGERLRAETPPLRGGLGGGPAIYAIASGKGGVGKSTVTANLAATLAAAGKRVGVLDADVWGYSIPKLFGVSRSPVVLGERMLPVPAHGVALMSVGFFVTENDPVVWRGPMLHKALSQFVTDTQWGPLDALFVDLPPGTGDATLSLLELLPDAVLLVVTTPQLTARSVASRVVHMVADSGGTVAGVVENMSSSVCQCCGAVNAVFGSEGGALLAEEAGVPLLGRVPLDAELREAGDRGLPVVLGSPDATSARELAGIAAGLPTPRRSLARRPLPLSVVSR
ncbi:MAG: Mrp/NBP35 family ATP-binding protein [Pseudonocardia sp.]|nr:Mrp/NBP35 family ATP-binding protein [Pseudonocardia sp.]